MRKRISSLFLAMLALFTSQGFISAQTENVVFENIFNTQEVVESWTVEGLSDATKFRNFLDFEGHKCMYIDLDNWTYMGTDVYAVSPNFTMGASENVVTFNHQCYGFSMTPMNMCAQLVIRENGSTTWTSIDIQNYPTGKTTVNSGNLAVPAEFNGKDVQLGFKVTGNMNDYEMWYIDDIKVTCAPAEELVETELYKDEWMNSWQYYTEGSEIWSFPSGYLEAMAYSGDNIDSYRVTPTIKLAKDNKISFDQKTTFFNGKESSYLSVCVREKGGNWVTLEGLQFGPEGDFNNVSGLAVPAEFNEKEVEFGFRYNIPDISCAGSWTLKNLIVKGMAPKKKEAGISFSQEEMTYEIGSPDEFVAPILNNPNERFVTYETPDWQLINVDYYTGKVTFNGKVGYATVIAKCAGDTEYEEGIAEYYIDITNPILVYETSFDDDCGFVEEGTNGVWYLDWGQASAYSYGKVTEETYSYFVSPEFTLDNNGNLVSFNQKAGNMKDWAKEAGLCIREIGGEWVDLPIVNYPTPETPYWEYVNTDDIEIPAEFNGKNVQIAFRFLASPESNTSWNVQKLVVTKKIERIPAGIAFDREVIEYAIGGNEEFVSPILSNPNNLKVSYRCDDGNGVVNLDIETGKVTIIDEGTATIVATTEKNNKYMGGKAVCKITVTDPYSIIKEKFIKDLGEWTEEGGSGVWTCDGWGNTCGTPNYDTEMNTMSYLVSPKITLGNNGNYVAWEHNGWGTWNENAHFVVREIGGEWVELSGWNLPEAYEKVNTGNIEIPAEFNGKEVQVAFGIYANGFTDYGWNINNLVVRKYPAVQADPEISFNVTEVQYTLEEEFVAPVLNNPNNVEVVYSSDNEEVATVNAATGEVKFIKEGVVTITATSIETEDFISSKASYTVTVSVPTGIEGVSADDLMNGKVYDLQGNRVKTIVKGAIYIVNGKKVIIK